MGGCATVPRQAESQPRVESQAIGAVAEAAVVGFPHPIKGQGIYAYVTLVTGSEYTDELKTDLVKLRYFAGLTCGQAAKVLSISHSTAEEHWAYVKAWLKAEIMAQDKSNLA